MSLLDDLKKLDLDEIAGIACDTAEREILSKHVNGGGTIGLKLSWTSDDKLHMKVFLTLDDEDEELDKEAQESLMYEVYTYLEMAIGDALGFKVNPDYPENTSVKHDDEELQFELNDTLDFDNLTISVEKG